MRQLGTVATLVALLVAEDARCQERDQGAGPKKELRALQGVWATAPRASGWQIMLSISGSSATLVYVNDAECLEATVTLDVEAHKSGRKEILVLRNPTLPATTVNNAALPSIGLLGVSIEIPYSLRPEMLLADRARFKIAGVRLFDFRVPGGEMWRAFGEAHP